MASASVVGQHPGQHRLDSEPALFVLQLPGVRKKLSPPRSDAARGQLLFQGRAENRASCPRTGPGPAGAAALPGGAVSAEGDGAAPRNPDRDRDRAESHRHGDRNMHRDSDHGGGRSRGTSLRRARVSTVRRDVSGRRGTHRDRGSRSEDSGHESKSSPGASSTLPLPRLTQARSGVVRLARPEPVRREAWSIFPPGLMPETGEGHRFEAKPVTQDWCDSCSRKITSQSVKCQNCSYTCHLECQRQVQLDCNQRNKTPSPDSSRSSTAPQHKQNEAKEEEEGGTKDLTEDEVRSRIEEYNAQVSENGMNLASDGSYTGFIKVHLRLSRPVTVPAVEPVAAAPAASSRLTATQDSPGSKDDGEAADRRTSFYLPCDCVVQLHISSLTSTSEVIQGLLKKFMVLDNPRKFALYRQTHRDSQDLFQKLPLSERPLLLRLIAGPQPELLSFVLKENETGEVEWHAFSVPELQNFLVILEKEEAERVRTVEQKYDTYRRKLQVALRQHDP